MTKPKHIGYFINQYPAVSHSFIRREILALEKLGWRVSRYAIRANAIVDSADQAEAELTQFIVKIPALSLLAIMARQLLFNGPRFFKTLLFAVRFNAAHQKQAVKVLIGFVEACVLQDWAKRQGLQHIHAHFGTNSATIVLFAKQLGGPEYSFTVHGPEEFDKPESLGLTLKIRHARFVVAISSYGQSQLYRWADFADWRKIRVVHCGLADDFLGGTPAPIPVAPVLACVGRLCEQKGQLLLLQAVARLVAEGVSIRLVLIGDGPLRGELENDIAGHQLTGVVELTGSLSGECIRERLAGARAFVLPSFAEGLPVVIMEAFALGRPVISTYVAGIPELVVNADNGWLVPAGSVDDLVLAMRQALQAEPETLADMGMRGRRRVMERHAIATEAGKLAELFAEFIDLPALPAE